MLIEQWPIDRIKPHDNNPRLNDKAVAAVGEKTILISFPFNILGVQRRATGTGGTPP